MGTHNIILNEREKKNKLSMSEYAKIQTMILKISSKQHNTDHMYINLLQGVPFKKYIIIGCCAKNWDTRYK